MSLNVIKTTIFLIIIILFGFSVFFFKKAYINYTALHQAGINSSIKMNKFFDINNTGVFRAEIPISPSEFPYKYGIIKFVILENQTSNDIQKILNKAQILVKLQVGGKIYHSQLSLDDQEYYNKHFIGYGKGRKAIPEGTIFFSTAPNKSVKSIHYGVGMNRVYIKIRPISYLDFQKLSIIIYSCKNGESIIPLVQLCIGLFFLVSITIPTWILFIVFKKESLLMSNREISS